MRIERNNPSHPASLTPSLAPAKRAASHSLAADLTESEKLNAALASASGVRAEKVARAKALIADPNYPTHAQLAKVANMLAANWEQGE